jgi:hypothetical protein
MKGETRRDCQNIGCKCFQKSAFNTQVPEWEEADKNDAWGHQIPSNSDAHKTGVGVEFIWGTADGKGQQKDNGYLTVDLSYFDLYDSLQIVIKSSSDIQYLKATITQPGVYQIVVPKWASKNNNNNKLHNINMVWLQFGNPTK